MLQDKFDEYCCDPKLNIDSTTQTISNKEEGFAICCGKRVIQNGMTAHWDFVVKKLSNKSMEWGTYGDNCGIGLINGSFRFLDQGMIDKNKLIYWWSTCNVEICEFGAKGIKVPIFENGSHLHIFINLLSKNEGRKLIFMKNDDIIYESKFEDQWPTSPKIRMFICLDLMPQIFQLVEAEIIHE